MSALKTIFIVEFEIQLAELPLYTIYDIENIGNFAIVKNIFSIAELLFILLIVLKIVLLHKYLLKC